MKKDKIDFWSMFTALEQWLLIVFAIVAFFVLYSIFQIIR